MQSAKFQNYKVSLALVLFFLVMVVPKHFISWSTALGEKVTDALPQHLKENGDRWETSTCDFVFNRCQKVGYKPEPHKLGDVTTFRGPSGSGKTTALRGTIQGETFKMVSELLDTLCNKPMPGVNDDSSRSARVYYLNHKKEMVGVHVYCLEPYTDDYNFTDHLGMKKDISGRMEEFAKKVSMIDEKIINSSKLARCLMAEPSEFFSKMVQEGLIGQAKVRTLAYKPNALQLTRTAFGRALINMVCEATTMDGCMQAAEHVVIDLFGYETPKSTNAGTLTINLSNCQANIKTNLNFNESEYVKGGLVKEVSMKDIHCKVGEALIDMTRDHKIAKRDDLNMIKQYINKNNTHHDIMPLVTNIEPIKMGLWGSGHDLIITHSPIGRVNYAYEVLPMLNESPMNHPVMKEFLSGCTENLAQLFIDSDTKLSEDFLILSGLLKTVTKTILCVRTRSDTKRFESLEELEIEVSIVEKQLKQFNCEWTQLLYQSPDKYFTNFDSKDEAGAVGWKMREAGHMCVVKDDSIASNQIVAGMIRMLTKSQISEMLTSYTEMMAMLTIEEQNEKESGVKGAMLKEIKEIGENVCHYMSLLINPAYIEDDQMREEVTRFLSVMPDFSHLSSKLLQAPTESSNDAKRRRLTSMGSERGVNLSARVMELESELMTLKEAYDLLTQGRDGEDIAFGNIRIERKEKRSLTLRSVKGPDISVLYDPDPEVHESENRHEANSAHSQDALSEDQQGDGEEEHCKPLGSELDEFDIDIDDDEMAALFAAEVSSEPDLVEALGDRYKPEQTAINFEEFLPDGERKDKVPSVNPEIQRTRNLPTLKGKHTIPPEPKCSYLGNEAVLTSNNGLLYLNSGLNSTLVGKTTDKMPRTICTCKSDNWLQRLDEYNDQVEGKGSGNDFGLWLHLSVCLMIAGEDPNHFLEPNDGGDVLITYSSDGSVSNIRNAVIIEVTGSNYQSRRASFVVNKYWFFGALVNDPDGQQLFSLAHRSDHHDLDMFKGSTIDQGASHITQSLDRIFNHIPGFTDEHVEILSTYVTKYVSEQPNNPISLDVTLPTDHLNNLMGGECKATNFTELTNGSFDLHPKEPCTYPSMYYALPRQEEAPSFDHENFSPLSFAEIDVYNSWEGRYRTVTAGEDILPLGIRKIHHDKAISQTRIGQFFQLLEEYEVIKVIDLECAMFSKVRGRGKNRFFFDNQRNMGIVWSSHNKSSTVYDCRFYSFQKPTEPLMEGVWTHEPLRHCKTREVSDEQVWVSPSFRVSNLDREYAMLLPHKVRSIFMATLCSVDKETMVETIQGMVESFTCMRTSTWHTSKIGADFRFMVIGGLTKSNNLPAMIRRLEKPVRNSIRSPDHYLLCLIRRSVFCPGGENLTPIFRLPIATMSIEKDFALSLQWHMREGDHDTLCCEKLVKTWHDDALNEDEDVRYYARQAEYFDKMSREETNYNDFLQCMCSAPDHPCLNVAYFLGLTHFSINELKKVATSESRTNYSMSNLTSDRGSLQAYYDKESGERRYKGVKVANNLHRCLRHTKATGSVSLLLRLLKGDKIANEFTIMKKDASKGERDISTGRIEMRPFQLLRESQCSIVSSSLRADYMLDKHKYANFVKDFSSVMRSSDRFGATSEDRSSFCMSLHPEVMALAYACIAVTSNSNQLYSAAANQRVNTSRLVILPSRFDPELLVQRASDPTKAGMRRVKGIYGTDAVFVKREDGPSVNDVLSLKLHHHMMQGIDGIGGSIVNAVANTGIVSAIDAAYEIINTRHEAVTSDDAARAWTIKMGKDVKMSNEILAYRPLPLLKHVMMVNNSKKFGLSEDVKELEINNNFILASGVVAQHPVSAGLCIQPLAGISVIEDLMTAFSNSRVLAKEGGPPLAVKAVHVRNIRLWAHKWLIRDGTLTDMFIKTGMLDTSMMAPYRGFGVNNELGLKIMYKSIPPDLIQRVKVGDIDPFHFIKKRTSVRYNPEVCENDDDEKKMVSDSPTECRLFNSLFTKIEISRKLGGRLRSCWARGMTMKQLNEGRQKCINYLTKLIEAAEGEDDPPEWFRILVEKPIIQTTIRRMRKFDLLPCVLGTKINNVRCDIKNLACRVFLGCHYQQRLDDDDQELFNKNLEDLEKMLLVEKQTSYREGFEAVCLAGKPVVNHTDTKKYLSPHVMEFDVKTNPRRARRTWFEYRGRRVETFRPCLWSNVSCAGILLAANKGSRDLMAFGTGKLNGRPYAFFRRRGANVECEDISSRRAEGYVEHKVYGQAFKVYFLTRRDLSAPSDLELKPYELPLISGSPTAMASYGGYHQSSEPGGFEMMRQRFTARGCDIPYNVRYYMPTYPIVEPNSHTVSASSLFFASDDMSKLLFNYVADGTRKCVMKEGAAYKEWTMSQSADPSINTFGDEDEEFWHDEKDNITGSADVHTGS